MVKRGKEPEKPQIKGISFIKPQSAPELTKVPKKPAWAQATPSAPSPKPSASPKTSSKPSSPKAPAKTSSAASKKEEAKENLAPLPPTTTSHIQVEIPELAKIPRIPALELFPVIEDGLWPAKAVVGEPFPIRATVFREGHDRFSAEAVLVAPDGSESERSLMYDIAPGLDRYEAWVCPDAEGDWTFKVESWSDPYQTWSHDAAVKIAAGVDVELMLEEGARLLERAAAGNAFHNDKQVAPPPAQAEVLRSAAAVMREHEHSAQTRLSAGLHSQIRSILRAYPLRDLCEATRSYPLRVVRKRALYGSWYEIFPRSIGATQNADGSWNSGTLRSAISDLDRIADMGFDVVYLTPVSPIGKTFRKGKNNSLKALPTDPGSPYAIGSEEGGHDAIHPQLGTFDDFDEFVTQARQRGLEVALDIALQCSPDHPWVKEHPQWFTTRADGTIAYAENPPKKYQDIYPMNFDNDPEGIYQAVYDLLVHWVEHGVTLFRVDNPHTKPLPFWQKLLAEFHANYPHIIFLAEAFTRPAMMRTLAQLGFHQSYCYFAWRNTKQELQDYLQELAHDSAHYMRPAFWPTTHDILTPFMTQGGAAAFALRAVLAATGSPTWGIYSGYELVEKEPRAGFEEQNDNEKYEFRPRDYSGETAQGMTTLLRTLNRIRRDHPALQQLRDLTIHPTSSDSLLCYSRHISAKYSPTGRDDTIIVVVNLDPHHTSEGMVDLDLAHLGARLGADGLHLRDELDGRTYTWGNSNFVRLDPVVRTAHVFSVEG